MKFGNTWDPNAADEGSSNSDYLRYFKNPNTTIRLLQEPDNWVDYWEHFNPNGYPFPCTRDRQTCPGCTSKNEKMSRAGKKVAVQVLEGEYVNAYKLPKTVADKLYTRSQRIGTITDRDYTIYKLQTKNADGSTKTDYDVEGGDKIPVDVRALEPKFKDIEAILAKMYEEAWGDPDAAMQTTAGAEDAQQQEDLKAKLAAQQQATDERVPDWAAGNQSAPQKMWSEDELRELPLDRLLVVCKEEGENVPDELASAGDTNKIVDWLLDQ